MAVVDDMGLAPSVSLPRPQGGCPPIGGPGVPRGAGGGEGVVLTFKFDKWSGWSSGKQAMLLMDEFDVDEPCCEFDDSGT